MLIKSAVFGFAGSSLPALPDWSKSSVNRMATAGGRSSTSGQINCCETLLVFSYRCGSSCFAPTTIFPMVTLNPSHRGFDSSPQRTTIAASRNAPETPAMPKLNLVCY